MVQKADIRTIGRPKFFGARSQWQTGYAELVNVATKSETMWLAASWFCTEVSASVKALRDICGAGVDGRLYY